VNLTFKITVQSQEKKDGLEMEAAKRFFRIGIYVPLLFFFPHQQSSKPKKYEMHILQNYDRIKVFPSFASVIIVCLDPKK
jgi:hypothetical protein